MNQSWRRGAESRSVRHLQFMEAEPVESIMSDKAKTLEKAEGTAGDKKEDEEDTKGGKEAKGTVGTSATVAATSKMLSEEPPTVAAEVNVVQQLKDAKRTLVRLNYVFLNIRKELKTNPATTYTAEDLEHALAAKENAELDIEDLQKRLPGMYCNTTSRSHFVLTDFRGLTS